MKWFYVNRFNLGGLRKGDVVRINGVILTVNMPLNMASEMEISDGTRLHLTTRASASNPYDCVEIPYFSYLAPKELAQGFQQLSVVCPYCGSIRLYVRQKVGYDICAEGQEDQHQQICASCGASRLLFEFFFYFNDYGPVYASSTWSKH